MRTKQLLLNQAGDALAYMEKHGEPPIAQLETLIEMLAGLEDGQVIHESAYDVPVYATEVGSVLTVRAMRGGGVVDEVRMSNDEITAQHWCDLRGIELRPVEWEG